MQRPTAIAVLALVVSSCGCAGPPGQRVSAADYQRMQEEVGAAEASVDRSREFSADQSKLEGELQQLVWQGEDVEYEQAELRAKRERVALEHARAEADERLAATRSERELAWARKDLEHFDTVERDRRLAEDALQLEMSEANLLETREELAQLELMYEGSQLGEATAEIVLERTRRRLAMAEKRHRIAQEKSAELVTIVLPRELEEHLAKVAEKTVALENARTNLRLQALQREAALRVLDHDEQELVRRLDKLARERGVLELDVRGLERSGNAAAVQTP